MRFRCLKGTSSEGKGCRALPRLDLLEQAQRSTAADVGQEATARAIWNFDQRHGLHTTAKQPDTSGSQSLLPERPYRTTINMA